MSIISCFSPSFESLSIINKASVTEYGRRRSLILLSLPFLILATVTSGDLFAAPYSQTVKNNVVKTEYQYSAKALCSLLLPHQDGSLARGTYRTAINIHNPTDKKITFVEKVALAGQPGTPPGV